MPRLAPLCLLIAACGQRVVLELPPDTKASVLAFERRGELDVVASEGLASVEAPEGTEAITALLYQDTLAELGLRPGALPRLKPGGPLPPADALRVLEGDTFVVADKRSTAVEEFRTLGRCGACACEELCKPDACVVASLQVERAVTSTAGEPVMRVRPGQRFRLNGRFGVDCGCATPLSFSWAIEQGRRALDAGEEALCLGPSELVVERATQAARGAEPITAQLRAEVPADLGGGTLVLDQLLWASATLARSEEFDHPDPSFESSDDSSDRTISGGRYFIHMKKPQYYYYSFLQLEGGEPERFTEPWMIEVEMLDAPAPDAGTCGLWIESGTKRVSLFVTGNRSPDLVVDTPEEEASHPVTKIPPIGASHDPRVRISIGAYDGELWISIDGIRVVTAEPITLGEAARLAIAGHAPVGSFDATCTFERVRVYR